MRPRHSHRSGWIMIGLLAMTVSGCIGTSQPSRFYMLSSLQDQEPAPQARSASQGSVVAVGPLTVPDYLNRPEIVTRAGKNEMQVNDFRRWADALDSNISRAIVDDLSVLLPADRFSVIRWNAVTQRNLSVAYQVTVDITRFEPTLGGTVFLEADWTVFGREKAVLLARRSGISGKANGAEFTDLVAAMSKAVEDLSREIAAGLTSLERKAPGK